MTGRRAIERVERVPRGWLILGAVLPLVLLGLWGVVYATRFSTPATARIGEPAPSLALADLDGRPLRLSDLRGRPVIVNFWASWCGPCVEEFPLLIDAEREYRAQGLAIIGVVFRDNSEAARDFMRRMGAGWPAAIDPSEAVASRFGIHAPPETFFIDRAGVVAGRQIGQLSAADLDRQLAKILD